MISTSDYYPFGSIKPQRSFSSTEYAYAYQGSEKDNEITNIEGAHVTTYFRELDTRIGRWWAVDPKVRLRPWESSYMSMGNNPIGRNDILGDKWKEGTGTKEKADDFRKRTKNLRATLMTKKAELEAKINGMEEGEKRKKLEDKLVNVNDRIQEANDALCELDEMELSDQVYELRRRTSIPGNTTYTMENGQMFDEAEQGQTYYEDGVVVMEYNHGDFSALAHELKHGYQFEVGEISFSKTDPKAGALADLTDEAAAFKRGSLYSGGKTEPLLVLTPAEVVAISPKAYGSFPSTSLTIFSTVDDIYKAKGRNPVGGKRGNYRPYIDGENPPDHIHIPNYIQL